MKNEFPSKIITHFAGIRSKEYAFKFLNGKEEKRAKGITKVNQKQNLNYADYEHSVFDNIVKVLTETKLQSNKLKMRLIEQEKTSLSNTDDKRVWVGRTQKYEDFDTTLAWGHYRLNTPSILCAG